ncbi:phosphate ABC transporter permease PstA [Lactobacillus gigeriorum]|uniref:Phosphate transport system permease protein PstA n=1 Tax=Lactobacillus gigeriorum DSM 23908 = CRBIP 24.85 TaxID=1423751 RepID=I7KP03_9LACO|nr:phosphate ABC transporter permease PstA [Lactobacillus gigeriorum]KRN10558.1 phosphate ABC superfamily ATP binding cassette transporter, membrane protein [Lactobacillus gigeriorum DSM 23908 = CRBIP 24.85]CCI87029.1 Phosphate ABC superfamily ATP binding cassette transporter, permease protein [Lactobacillus gigeriorum DSM 23908 = CRBIP 24.85]
MDAKKVDRIAKRVIQTMVLMIVVLLVLILGYILVTGLSQTKLDFIFKISKAAQAGGGIRDQLFNSLYLLVLALLISVPLSLGAGIYLAEYAPDNWFTRMLKTLIEILSSLPSIVVGLFAYLVLVIKFQIGFSIIAGAMALTFFNLPLLTSNIENAFRNLPDSQREAGLALGLSQWKMIKGILLPRIVPSIITAVILSSGRIFGEAAALIYTSGQSAPILNYANWNPFSPDSPLNIMRPAETLAVHIWKLNSEGLTPDADAISAAASAVLIIVVLLFNISAHYFGEKLEQKLTAKR